MYLNRFLPTVKYDNIPYGACVKVRSIWCLTSLYSKAFAGFWPSTCKREPAFSNETSTLGTVFENLPFIVSENAVFGRFSGKREVKISFLKNIRILVDGARKRINAVQVEDIHFVIDLIWIALWSMLINASNSMHKLLSLLCYSLQELVRNSRRQSTERDSWKRNEI